MKNPNLLLIALLSWNVCALAAPPMPTGGALQPPAQNELPQAPPPTTHIEQFHPNEGGRKLNTDPEKFTVNQLEIQGVQMFSLITLIDITGFRFGRAYTLLELRSMASSIEHYYRDHGYPVAQAYLNQQVLSDGSVTITVWEGRYGEVLIRNQSKVSSTILADGLQDIKSGDLVVAEPLERLLLLLSDLPGVQIQSALVPGSTVGTSNLMIDVVPRPRVSGSVDADNAGNYYSGAVRAGISVFVHEAIGEGDVASLRLLTAGEGLNYIRAAYQLQIGQVRTGAALSQMEYALGHEFESLLANGTTHTMGIYGSYPVMRSHSKNLQLSGSYDSKRFVDRLDSVAYTTEKSAHVYALSATGDIKDEIGAGGLSSFALALSSGQISIQTASARALDLVTAQSNGSFNKLAFSTSRLQAINPSISLYASINGQIASKNLDASEKMQMGGMYGIRAYPDGEGYGDEAYVLSFETRLLMPHRWQPPIGSIQLLGFIDTGSVKLYKNPWNTDSNQRSLSGVGIGLNWTGNDRLQLRMAYAHKLGDETARSAPDADDRLWLQGLVYF